MTPATNWTPGLVVLAVAAVVGVLFLLLTRKKGAGGSEDPRLLDLERRAQLLVEQLRELAAEKHHMGEAEFAAERTRLEHAAAAALKTRDTYLGFARTGQVTPDVEALYRDHFKESLPKAGERPTAPPPPRAPTGFWGRHPQLKGAAWGAVVVAFFGGIMLWVVNQERPRGDGEITGKIPEGGAAAGPAGATRGGAQLDPEVERLRARVQQNPTDLDATADLAHALILRQGFDEAQTLTERSLAVDPFHLESRIHRAVLASTSGDVNGGFRELERLSRVQPGAHEALFFLGAMAIELGDAPRALDSFERFAAEAPAHEQPPQLGLAINELRQQVRGTP